MCLRAVLTVDYMSATAFRFEWEFMENVSNRIVNEVEGVSRVFFDGKYIFKASVTSPTITRALDFSHPSMHRLPREGQKGTRR